MLVIASRTRTRSRVRLLEICVSLAPVRMPNNSRVTCAYDPIKEGSLPALVSSSISTNQKMPVPHLPCVLEIESQISCSPQSLLNLPSVYNSLVIFAFAQIRLIDSANSTKLYLTKASILLITTYELFGLMWRPRRVLNSEICRESP